MTRSPKQLRALVHPPTSVKRSNPARQATERLRANGDELYKTWLHSQPCAICGYAGSEIEEMHVKGGGAGRKADRKYTIPACGSYSAHTITDLGAVYRVGWQTVEGCHPESHRIGVKSFAKKHGVNLLALAAQTQQQFAAWLLHQGASE